MKNKDKLYSANDFDVVKVTKSGHEEKTVSVASEVPLTIVANDVELATFLCSPIDLEEMTYGFLYTSNFISSVKEIISFSIDEENWKATLKLKKTPDKETLSKRLFTSGCGRGVMYASTSELPTKLPLANDIIMDKTRILEIMRWFQGCSNLHKTTRGVHSAAFSFGGETPKILFDDVGRHNAVDKVIGCGLREGIGFGQGLLLVSGRVSSEIIHKAGKCGVPFLISLSSPTHQGVLASEVMNITLICFARGGSFTVFTNGERVKL